MHRDDGMLIYPVIEFKDLVYAHQYGWLGALVETTEGVLLKPEPALTKAFKANVTIKEFLVRQGLPRDVLSRLRIMMDHGISTNNFREVFGLDKTPKNLVLVYKRLGVDLGVAYDVPVKLTLQAVIELVLNGRSSIDVDDGVKDVVREMVEALRSKLARPTREKAVALLKKNNGIVKELSRMGVEVTLNRLSEMLDHAVKLGFNGLVPVVQGLFKDDIEYSVRETIRLVSQVGSDWLIAVGTGGRVLSHGDAANVVFAIRKIREYARKYNVNVRVHVLGWSGPDTLPPFIVGEIYSADSHTPRKRAIEGKIYIAANGGLVLKHVSEVGDYSCNCPACSRPELRRYVLERSSRRRTYVRLVHNAFMLMSYINRRMYQLGTWVA
jgi:hypothetical protein